MVTAVWSWWCLSRPEAEGLVVPGHPFGSSELIDIQPHALHGPHSCWADRCP